MKRNKVLKHCVDIVNVVFMMVFVFFPFSAQGVTMPLSLSSPTFEDHGFIPSIYTCDGEDISPPLAWRDVPAGTKSFVLIMDDPDAPVGIWDHWILFNISANARELAEATDLPAGASEGVNSWGRIGYGGPCPPKNIHRYFFKLYALDTVLSLHSRATKADVEAAMQNHILGKAELIGRYER